MDVVGIEPESYRTARALNHWTSCAATSFMLNISNSSYEHCCGNYFTTFKLSSESLCQTIFKAKWPFEGGTCFLYFPSGDYNFCYVRGLCLSIWWKGIWCKNHFGSQSQLLKLVANRSGPKNCPIMSSRTKYCPLLVMATAWDSIWDSIDPRDWLW